MSSHQTHHMQTPEGRRISAEGRRRRLAALPAKDAPQVFVVRLAGAMSFGWEIRKFGSFVLSRSQTGFETQLLAQTAGDKAIAVMSASGI